MIFSRFHKDLNNDFVMKYIRRQKDCKSVNQGAGVVLCGLKNSVRETVSQQLGDGRFCLS